MKFYERNKIIASVITVVSVIGLGCWVALVVLHSMSNQSIGIFQNQMFASGFNACQGNYTNISYGGVPYDAVNGSTPTLLPYGHLLTMNHQIYHTSSLAWLFASGGFQFIVFVLSFFLILKSKVPYKNTMWYLTDLDRLKISINILAGLGLVGGATYFGYTLTFYLNLGKNDCANADIGLYAAGYFINAVIGGVMLLFYLLNYVLTISIQQEPGHLKEDLFGNVEEETKIVMDPLVDVEAQRKVVEEELPKIQKINQPIFVEMTEQPPQGFNTNYVSQEAQDEAELSQSRLLQSNQDPSRFLPPPTHPQPNPNPYTPPKEPLAVSQIELNIQDPHIHPYNRNNGSSNFLRSYNSPEQRSRLKIFDRGGSGSKQRPIIGSMKNKFSRNY